MARINSTFAALVVAAIAAGGIAFAVDQWSKIKLAERSATLHGVVAPAAPKATTISTASTASRWAASAAGRVEPRGGQVKIGAQMPGKVAQVLVRMNDAVKAGDLLVKIVDDDPAARVAAAASEVAVRQRERDEEKATGLAAGRRTAEDAASTAERAYYRARWELDRLQARAADGTSLGKEIEAARKVLAEAATRRNQERANLARVEAQDKMPLPVRLEASLATARAELSIAEAALERTRIRAPRDGTVLQINTRSGETVTPSPEDTLLVFGDLTRLRVRAEIEERDIGKIRVGQSVVVRSDAFPGQDYTGKVERIARALGPPRIAAKGPRRPGEQDVLQVLIDLDGQTRLLPGLRVDVFFRPDETVGTSGASTTRAN
jgi:HlyD family secretion protein